ncbi:MAG: FAD-binding oxidoreductase [Candidatus Helarchaeales archaeon]
MEVFKISNYIADLSRVIGADNLSTDESVRLAYARDCFPLTLLQFREPQILERPVADVIVWPRSVEDVSKILKFANDRKIPVIPHGGGGGVNGGTIPLTGGIMLDVQKLNKIIEINEESLYVTVQAGMIGQHLEEALNRKGFTFGHLPSSLTMSTIGGFVANRSAGAFSSKYGKIEDMVLDLEIVLPSGEIIHTNPTKAPRKAVGPDLTQLFIGSEGCLGVITEVTLKIFPKPEIREFLGFLFPTLHDGFEAVHDIFRTSIRPSIVRLYESVEARMVYKIEDIKKEEAYLTLAFDGYENTKEITMLEKKICHDICMKHGAKDMGEEGGRIWFENRLNMYYPNKEYYKMHVLADTIDVVTTFDNLENLFYKMKEAIGQRKINVMAHWSHFYPEGGSMYLIFVLIQKNKNHKAEILYQQAWENGLRACIEAGGVLSHHHGVGLFKGAFMEKQLGPAFTVLKKLKKSLDPNNIMNPGKLGFPLDDEK